MARKRKSHAAAFKAQVALAALKCHWKCSVYYQETIKVSYPFCFRWTQPRIDVVYVDNDHLHLVAKEEAPMK